MLSSSIASLTVITVAGGGIAVLIVSLAVQLFASASTAARHLARGSALASAAPAAAAPGFAGANATSNASSDNDASQQVFAQLNAYYAANISQGNAIFWASLLTMSLGFAIVFAGIVSAGSNGVTAIVAGIAGILSQFIGATFLIALRSTQQQATTYAQSLVELRLRDVARNADAASVSLGLRLLDEIANDRTNPANTTKAAIALGAIVKTPAVEHPPAYGNDPDRIAPVAERRARTATFNDANPATRR